LYWLPRRRALLLTKSWSSRYRGESHRQRGNCDRAELISRHGFGPGVEVQRRSPQSALRQDSARHIVVFHGRRRGHHAGTARRYASYCAPYLWLSIGSSYQCTNAVKEISTTNAYPTRDDSRREREEHRAADGRHRPPHERSSHVG
jgi:hypothetical protein